MTSLKEKITADWKAAMKAGERARKDALSLLLATIKQKQIDTQIELDDAGVMSVIDKMLKQRRDSIAQFTAANRQDLADAEKFEAEVLASYMPQPFSRADLETIVQQTIVACGASTPADMGKVIALLKPQVAGRADMAEVSRLVKAALGAAS
jgi:uncharacterized protein YqeY